MTLHGVPPSDRTAPGPDAGGSLTGREAFSATLANPLGIFSIYLLHNDLLLRADGRLLAGMPTWLLPVSANARPVVVA